MRPGHRTLAEMAAVFAGCALLFFAMLSQHPGLLDVDTLYHYKVARLIREHGPWVDISWLPFTVLGERGPDHQWLFHLLIAPLTLMGDNLQAVVIASAVLGAAMPAAVLPLLKRAGVPGAVLFALAMMFASSLMPGRFLTLRAQDLAVVLMLASMLAMVWRKTLWIGVLAFAFTESYHGAVILGILLAATLGAAWLLERKAHTASITAVAVGVMAGLLASPWFPANVRYLVFHTFFKAADPRSGLFGIEWHPIPYAAMAVESWPAHLLLASGVAAWGLAARRAGWRLTGVDTLSCCAVTVVFFAMYHFAWRFAEYYVPFAVVSAALLWRDALARLGWGAAPRRALAGVLVALIGWGAWQGAARLAPALSQPFDAYADMMRYVDARDPQPMIFNSLWSDFQPMMFWSGRGRFVTGLDGHYLLYGDLARFKVWNEIATGRAAARGGNAREIRETFGAGWVVLPRGHEAMAAALSRDPDARLALETREGWLFRLEPRAQENPVR